LRGQDLQQEEKNKIMEELSVEGNREIVTMFLREIQAPKRIPNQASMKSLSEILSYLLTVFIHQQDQNYKTLYAIVRASQFVFYQNEAEKKKLLLSTALSAHAIWQEKQIWVSCIQKCINQKFVEAVHQPQAFSKKQDKGKESWLSSGFGIKRVAQGIWSAGEGLTGKADSSVRKESFDNEDEHQNQAEEKSISKGLAKNIVFNLLSQFSHYFITLYVDF